MIKFTFLLSLVLSSFPVESREFTALPQAEQSRIADLIFRNECNRKVECLVSWNDGEAFASLGIGHFIWFPQGSNAPFQESFPDLVRWFNQEEVVIPRPLQGILQPHLPCPWQTKQDFLKPENQALIQELRRFLANTKREQAGLIMHRLSQALLKMLKVTSNASERAHIRQQFERVAQSPSGWYILADYVNFKGEGTNPKERYQGQGWGLVQVLLQMKGDGLGAEATTAFADAARLVLERRVRISPPSRNEKRWLKGWVKRLNTYR